MPTAHGRRRHAGRSFARPTHSGFRPMLFGGEHVPSESGGAMRAVARTGLDYEAARDGEQAQMPDIGPEAVDTGSIRPGSLTRPLFAETIIPPEVLDALPTLPDADYPQGVLVFLTTDMKLYRNTDGSTWSVAVDGADIVANSVTAGQIAAGAIGTTELAADAVIANVANVGGTVTIDDTGITITDGALTFLDDSGQTVLTGAGFGATWVDFLDSHVYNHSFRAGNVATISAATIVSGADTDADYAASMSDDIPYWGVSFESGAGTLERVADSDAVSGFAMRWSGDENAEIFQDIPISPGQVYSTYITWKWSNSASSFFSTIGCQFRGKNHEDIGASLVDQSLLFTTSQATYITQGMNWSETAPGNARYLRVFISFSRSTGSPAVRVAAVNVDPINVYGPQRVIAGSTQYDTGTGIGWNNGTTVDVVIERTGTSEVTVKNPLSSAGDLRVQGSIRSGTGGGNSIVRLDAAGYIALQELTSVPGGASDSVRIYVDDSAGTTRLRAVGPGGVRVTLATF